MIIPVMFLVVLQNWMDESVNTEALTVPSYPTTKYTLRHQTK
jgi:hypothetical protein